MKSDNISSIDPAIVEFANDAFYLAFNMRDLPSMEALWAKHHPVVCIHPGWPPLFGREEVLQSWEEIFSGQQQAPGIACYGARVFPQGDVVTVVCYEQLPAGWLVATNNYVLEAGDLKLVHHQASQCAEPEDIESLQQSIQ